MKERVKADGALGETHPTRKIMVNFILIELVCI